MLRKIHVNHINSEHIRGIHFFRAPPSHLNQSSIFSNGIKFYDYSSCEFHITDVPHIYRMSSLGNLLSLILLGILAISSAYPHEKISTVISTPTLSTRDYSSHFGGTKLSTLEKRSLSVTCRETDNNEPLDRLVEIQQKKEEEKLAKLLKDPKKNADESKWVNANQRRIELRVKDRDSRIYKQHTYTGNQIDVAVGRGATLVKALKGKAPKSGMSFLNSKTFSIN